MQASAQEPVSQQIEGIRPRFVLVPLLLLATIPLSRLDPTSGSHAAWARPLAADLHVSIGPGVAVPIALAVLIWLVIPRISVLSTGRFLASAVALATVFAASLAMEARGFVALTGRFAQEGNYWSQVPLVDRLGPRAFDATYSTLFPPSAFPITHAAVHPPGALLFLWTLSKLTGGNVRLVCLLVVLIGCLGAVPTYFFARAAYNERTARGAALLFVASPGVLLYSGASGDALFITITALALAALIRAPRSDAWALAAGAMTMVALCFTFGALALAPLFLGMLLLVRRQVPVALLLRRSILVIVGMTAVAIVAKTALSIDLIAIFRSVNAAQSNFDRLGGRHYRYWVWADAAAFFISAGIVLVSLFAAEVAARWRARSRGMETVLLATIVLISATGLTRGETDRIWLLFVAILCAAAAASAREVHIRWVAAAGLAQALLIQCVLLVWGR